jgi:hypothetical protein
MWINIKGCPYCKQFPLSNQLVQVSYVDPVQKIEQLMAQVSHIRVKIELLEPSTVFSYENNFIPENSEKPTLSLRFISVNGVAIVFQGTVGCGKTSFSKELIKQIEESKQFQHVKRISPDDYNKNSNTNGKRPNAVEICQNEIKDILKKEGSIFLIIDTCGDLYNENDPNKICFNVSLKDLKVIVFKPNFIESDMKGYLSFSLYNVLCRGIHSSETDYYLNPISAGTETCVKVHSNKARALFGNKFFYVSRKNDSLENIKTHIQPQYIRYKNSLPSVQTAVADFIAKHL